MTLDTHDTHDTLPCLFLISVDSFCLFPDVVDSHFTEQVDSLPDIVDSIPGFVVQTRAWRLFRPRTWRLFRHVLGDCSDHP